MISLNIAVEFDFPNVLASLLGSGEDLNECYGHRTTPLARSVRKSKRAVDLHLDANVDINANGWEDLWYNEIDDVGSEVEVKPFVGTPLVMAAVGEDLEMVECFIQRGAEINFAPSSSLTPLFAAYIKCAFEIGSKANEILRLLLRSRVDICFGTKDEDRVAMTLLHCVAIDKDPSILPLLLGSETADINFQLRELPSNVLMENDDQIEGQSCIDGGRASSNKCTLSQNGSDSGSGTDTSGFREGEDSEVGTGAADDTLFIPNNDYGSGVSGDDHQPASSMSTDSSLSESYKKGATPLPLAARDGSVKNVKLILEHGADPHIKNADGHTAIDFVLKLAPTEGSGDDEAFTFVQAEMTELLEKYSRVSSDGEETLPTFTFIDG